MIRAIPAARAEALSAQIRVSLGSLEGEEPLSAMPYQDGGIGNGLEMRTWNPHHLREYDLCKQWLQLSLYWQT